MSTNIAPPTPRHGGHPLPVVLPLEIECMKDTTMWFRDLFHEDDQIDLMLAASVLQKEIHLQGGVAKNRELIRQTKPNWFRFLDEDKESPTAFLRKLELFASRARLSGYEPWLLLGRPEAGAAYRSLLETGCILGHVASELDAHTASGGERANLESYIQACAKILARQSGCHFWTAYVWRGGEILPTLVAAHSLWYPEAVLGLGHTSPRLLVRRGDKSRCVEVFGEDGETPRSGRGFQVRECVTRCWAVHLAVGRDSALIYLNWRRPGEEGPADHTVERPCYRVPSGVSRVIDRVLDGLTVLYRLDERGNGKRMEARSLDPAIRYMSGWLSERTGPTLPDRPRQPVSSVTARGLQRAVFDSLQHWLGEGGRPHGRPSKALTKRLEDDLRGIIVHDILGERLGKDEVDVELMLMSKQGLRLPQKPLYGWGGELVSHDGFAPIVGEERGLLPPNSSLAAQSITWATALLLEDLPGTAERWRNPAPTALVRRVLSTNAQAAARSELAIPLFGGEEPLGAISVEVARCKAVSRQHIHWIETLGLLIGAIVDVVARLECESERTLLRETFRERATPPDNEEDLWRVLTEWVTSQTEADLVHVVTRGDGAGMLDRFGAIASSRYISDACEELQDRRSMAYTRRLLGSKQPKQEEAGIREMIRAERAGVTRNLLLGVERDYHWNPGDQRPQRRWLTGPLLGGARGLAISSNPRVTPYAVLWLGWCDPRVAENHQDLQRVTRLASVFAALHLAYRVEDLTVG